MFQVDVLMLNVNTGPVLAIAIASGFLSPVTVLILKTLACVYS